MNNSIMMEKAQRLIRGISTLPTIPDISLRVSSLMQSPDIDLQKVADLILSDQVLTARVIKIVNSPLFRPLQEITSLRHALAYLGLRRIHEIVFTCSLIKVFEGADAEFDIRALWQHSFGVGIMAGKLAELLSFPESETAYTAGILHDMGKVFLCSYLRHEWLHIIRLAKDLPCAFIEAEKRTMGTTHCEIGYCLAQQWHFPEAYSMVMAYHHAPADAPPDHRALAALVNLANSSYLFHEAQSGDEECPGFILSNEASWADMQQARPELLRCDVEGVSRELAEVVPEIRKLTDDLFA